MRRRLQIIPERAGCKRIRFHDLRHTFSTLPLESGMDVKPLSAMLGHVSAATTLNIYTHVTGDMQSKTATKIGRGLGNEVREESAQSEQSVAKDFQPVLRKTWTPGTGYITQINDHLFEGRYSPPPGRTAPSNPNASTPTHGRSVRRS
ncbi:tyrosine-type recombinase/integrase [Agathobaculum massiliense]|uniref:tyrosine-type recombinase/integrase n=1 Tax=Butyricicoccaceae TaxID=3085642 RepID=UPI0038B2CA63